MFKRIPVETKKEILAKVKSGQTVAEAAKQYALSIKTIYAWLVNEPIPELSVVEYNRLKRENEELKRIIGLITLELERGKKIEIIGKAHNKKSLAECMNINRKNIYHQGKKLILSNQNIPPILCCHHCSVSLDRPWIMWIFVMLFKQISCPLKVLSSHSFR